VKQKLLLSLLMANALYSGEVTPIKVHVTQECSLSDTEPFKQTYENSIFKITLEDEALLGDSAAIKEISLRSDGKVYIMKAGEEHVYRKHANNLIRKNYEFFADEIKAISNAKFVKLFVRYKEHVNEELSSNGTSSYFTTVKTTVAKDQYFPIILKHDEISDAFLQCSETFEEQKERQSLIETAIVIGAILGIMAVMMVVIVLIMRLRRNKKE